jgi:hypothetical protein
LRDYTPLRKFLNHFEEEFSMARKRVKSIEEWCLNYALSSPKGAVNQYWHWRSKGFDKDNSIKKATSYLWSMI